MPPSPVSTQNDRQREYNPRSNRRGQQDPGKEVNQLVIDQQEAVKMENNLNILFNQSKDEMFSLTSGYKKFQRELKNFKIFTNREDITLEKLIANRIFVSIGPQKKFTSSEIEALKSYVNTHNGSLLILLTEGGESKSNTNINYLLEEFGIFINNDAIVRTTYYKYFNPKEALVSDGVLNRALSESCGKLVEPSGFESMQSNQKNHVAQSLQFVYPFGSTLNVQKPAVAVLSSGTICFPINRPLCAFYGNIKKQPGKICVLGSSHIFHDTYIDKEENRKILEVIFKFLTDDTFVLNSIDAEDPEISEYNFIPNINTISDRVKTCLQDSEEIPRDIAKLFDTEVFSLDLSQLPKGKLTISKTKK
jgi:intraflagellar transport protein 52